MNELPKDAVQMIIAEYESKNSDAMGHLHNRFIGYISESRLPIPMVIAVLSILLQEAIQIAQEKYCDGGS